MNAAGLRRWTFGLGLLAVLSLLVALPLSAQENGDAAALNQRVTTFLRNLESKTRTAEETFTAFLADGRLRDRTQDIKKLVESHAKLVAQYGPARSFEQVAARNIGKDVYALTYLAKTDTYPIVWYVTFYRAPASDEKPAVWGVISLRFDTRVEDVPGK